MNTSMARGSIQMPYIILYMTSFQSTCCTSNNNANTGQEVHLHPLQYLPFAILHSLALQNTLISATEVINNPNECRLPTQIVTATEVTVASGY